jgi:HlyD family secretion protein
MNAAPDNAAPRKPGLFLRSINWLSTGLIKVTRWTPEKASAAEADPKQRLDDALRPIRRIALATIVICFGGFAAWAHNFQLASAAIAPGTVSPETSRKSIQHLEGGIIRAITVKEGDRVTEGQTIMRLETTQAQANYSARREQWLRLMVMRVRLEAHDADRDRLAMPESIRNESGNAELTSFIDNQIRAFELRRGGLLERDAIFNQQARQLEEEIKARKIENDGLREQLQLIEKELKEKEFLVQQRLVRTPEYYAVLRQRAATRAKIGSNMAEISRAEQKVEEVRLQSNATRTQFRDQNAQELTKTNSDIAQIDEAMVATGDILKRTDVVAPVSGTVLNMRFKTIGGVVRPGDMLLEIVPTEDELIIEARLSPLDVDNVSVGMAARVQLSAFSTKFIPPVDGKILQVSADALADQQSGQRYFPVKVSIDKATLARLNVNIQIKAGMPADVFIIKRERSFLGYLSEPITRSFRRAFREE